MFRLPATTALVSRSPALHAAEVILIASEQFEDDRRRIVVGPDISDDTMKALGEALTQYEQLEGMRRWLTDLVSDHQNGRQHG